MRKNRNAASGGDAFHNTDGSHSSRTVTPAPVTPISDRAK